MSLDVYLTQKREEPTRADTAAALLRSSGFGEFADEIEARHETGDMELFSANITHNLICMAEAAGIYRELWRPEELGISKARELIEPLKNGLDRLRSDPSKYKAFNPKNGWGNYEGLVSFASRYLSECEEYPDADVRTCK